MARPVPGDPLKDSTPILSPTATPVDTFVRPARPSLSKGAALAQALGGLDRIAKPILDKKFEEAKEREIAEGEQAFMQNREDFAEAVRKGVIPAGASPYVRKGYRKAQLHTLGANYAVELARSLEESDLHKVDDPAAIEDHIGKFYNQFLEANNISGFDEQELSESFGPMAQKAHDGFRSKQAQKNIEFIEAERFRAAEGEILSSLDMHSFSGGSAGASVQNMVTFLEAKAAELDGEGHDRTRISRTMVDIVTSAAEARDNMNILKILETTKLGTGPLSNTQYGRAKLDRSRERIIAAQDRAQRRAEAASRRARTAAKDEAETQFYRGLIEGDEDMMEQGRSALAQLDGRAFWAATRAEQTMGDEDLKAREAETWSRTRARVYAAEDMEETMSILQDEVGLSITPDTADRLKSEKRRLLEDDEWEAFYTNPTVSKFRSNLERAVAQDNRGIVTDRSARAALEATAEFDDMLFRFKEKMGTDVDPGALMKFLRDASDIVLEANKPKFGGNESVLEGDGRSQSGAQTVERVGDEDTLVPYSPPPGLGLIEGEEDPPEWAN